MNEITSIVYLSRAGEEFHSRAARQQLKIYVQNENVKHNITGLLIYCEGVFLQIIEGPAATIDALYARISKDTRHAELDLIARSESAGRLFGKWSMGIVETEDADETPVHLADRIAAVAAQRKRLLNEELPASVFIEAFLDPASAGDTHEIR